MHPMAAWYATNELPPLKVTWLKRLHQSTLNHHSHKVTRLEETIQPLRFRSFLGLTATALSFTAALRLRAIFRQKCIYPFLILLQLDIRILRPAIPHLH